MRSAVVIDLAAFRRAPSPPAAPRRDPSPPPSPYPWAYVFQPPRG